MIFFENETCENVTLWIKYGFWPQCAKVCLLFFSMNSKQCILILQAVGVQILFGGLVVVAYAVVFVLKHTWEVLLKIEFNFR